MKEDLVGEYIELKKQDKETKERLLALEVMIFDDEETHKEDPRITLVAPRETITLTEECYLRLELTGVETEITIPESKQKKSLKDFDIEIQNQIKNNPSNFETKYSKPSIRIK